LEKNNNTQGLYALAFLAIMVLLVILTFFPDVIPMSKRNNGITLLVLGSLGLWISYTMRKERNRKSGGMK
jgi:hypothetical protein